MKFKTDLILLINMVKIAFGYKRRIGKDTSCDYLVQKYGGVKLSFAEPLYKILYFAQDICGFEQTKDRKFLQFIGTDWARTINNNVWAELLVEKVKEKKDDNIYVSDLRFKNEFNLLKEQGFVCVKIDHKDLDIEDGYLDHQSDKDLDNFDGWDYTIQNFGSLDNLYDQLDHLYDLFE